MKPVVYVIPGTLCDESLWQQVSLSLSGIELIHLAIPRGASMDEVVLKLVAEIRKLNANQPFSLIGFSLGGYLASAVTLQCKNDVDRLMVLSNIPFQLPAEELQQRKGIVNWLQQQGYSGLSTKRALAMVHADNAQNTELIEQVRRMSRQFSVEDVLLHMTVLSERYDLTTQLTALECPIWFGYGDQDHLVDQNVVENMSVQSAYIRSFEVADSGHMLPLEQPKVLAKLIGEWFESNK